MRINSFVCLVFLNLPFNYESVEINHEDYDWWPPKLPTLYEYYFHSNNSIISGLEAQSDQFTLNRRPFVIFSGSLHYFRVVPERWRQTLKKFKTAGLNTVQFYVPWNWHQPQPEYFDFNSPWRNLTRFLVEIRQADLFAIVRVGPYICAEWEFGGFPAWLLRDPNMVFRSRYRGFLEPVRVYFIELFKILSQFQFTDGGPIIAVQFENEYFSAPLGFQNLLYLQHLQQIILNQSFKQLLFTSDPVEFARLVPIRGLKNVLETANLNTDSYKSLMQLRKNQTNKPVYASEFWPGWFDSWNDIDHHRYSVEKFEKEISDILFRVNGSVNFYMFVGGTNFGWWNGARVTTSYDYDAPLTESGNYTEKYWITRKLYDKLVASGRHPRIKIASTPPSEPAAKNYGRLRIEKYLTLDSMIYLLKPTQSNRAVFMESIESCSGYGFILYRMMTPPFKTLNITGPIRDRALLMINGQMVAQTKDETPFLELQLDQAMWFSSDQLHTIDILVENLGRINWGSQDQMIKQTKGINSSIFIDKVEWSNFSIFTFDLNQTFMESLSTFQHWTTYDSLKPINLGPALYQTWLDLTDEPSKAPQDSFLILPGWNTGNVIINKKFNIGRYNAIGPQRTLYLPAPFLIQGQNNSIQVFELTFPGTNPELIDHAILEY